MLFWHVVTFAGVGAQPVCIISEERTRYNLDERAFGRGTRCPRYELACTESF